MTLLTVSKAALTATIVATSFLQFQNILVKTTYGEGPLTAPITSPITPTPTEEPPLTSPEQNPSVTPTPTDTPLTSPEQSEPETSPTVTPTVTPAPVSAPAQQNNTGGSNNGGSSNGNNGNSGQSTCTSEAPKSGPLLMSVRKINRNTALLTWMKGWNPVNGYIIWYGKTKDASQYSLEVAGEEQVKTLTISGLNPSSLYYFKVQPKNGCKTGAFSNTVASNGRVVYTTGGTQGVSYTAKQPPSLKRQNTTVTVTQPATPKTQTVFEKVNGFLNAFFK